MSLTRRTRLALMLFGATCAACAGTFTRVPLPTVSRAEEREVLATTPALSLHELDRRLRRNYDRIVSEEIALAGGLQVPAELPPAWLTTLTAQQLGEVGRRLGPRVQYQLSEAVARAQAPLALRVERVGRRVALAANRPELVFILDANAGLGAGAPAGFRTSTVFVGPQLVMLSESEDGLAFILGHEAAHITHGHTRNLAVQTLLVGTLQVATMAAVAVAQAAACGRGADCLTQAEVQRSMATAASPTGLLARGTITATGFGRDEEREADYHGLRYAAEAGYRSAAGAEVFRELLAVDRGGGSALEVPFLRTHPTHAERIVRLAKWARGDVDAYVPVATTIPEPTSQSPRVAEAAASTSPGATTTGTCWLVAGAGGALCTACCDGGGCETHCKAGNPQPQGAASFSIRSCWNVDGTADAARAVCTTCCSASVSCSTTCGKVALVSP